LTKLLHWSSLLLSANFHFIWEKSLFVSKHI
jgi:hypothetical protein